jgi:hypothetical protein
MKVPRGVFCCEEPGSDREEQLRFARHLGKRIHGNQY